MITWNTDVNAPGCPGEIVNDDGRTILIQVDYDYPGTASTFGWDISTVQHTPDEDDCGNNDPPWNCEHDGTDGTVECPHCGMKPSAFISAAYDWLIENDGVTANDPGYFDNGE